MSIFKKYSHNTFVIKILVKNDVLKLLAYVNVKYKEVLCEEITLYKIDDPQELIIKKLDKRIEQLEKLICHDDYQISVEILSENCSIFQSQYTTNINCLNNSAYYNWKFQLK